MFNFIINFFTTNKKDKTVFNKQYRNGYNKLWINNLRDYNP